MELRFLGTSAGVPTKERNLSGIALIEEKGKSWYLIDCGEGTQHRILNTNLSLSHLKIVFITHIHGDHSYGLPGLLASAAMGGRKDPITIVAPFGIEKWIESAFENTGLYLPFEIDFIKTYDGLHFDFRDLKIESALLCHRVPSYAYSFTEKNVEPKLDTDKLKKDGIAKGPLWGVLKNGKDVEFEGNIFKSSDYIFFDRKPRKIVIAGDNDKPELLSDLCKKADVLVHESTYTSDLKDKAGEGGHSYAKAVGKFAESENIPNLILTHFSPRYQTFSDKPSSTRDHYLEAQSVYSGNINIAEDFSLYTLDKSKNLKMTENEFTEEKILKVMGK